MAALVATVIGTLLGALAGFGFELERSPKSFLRFAMLTFLICLAVVPAAYVPALVFGRPQLELLQLLKLILSISVALPAVIYLLFGGRVGDFLEWLYNVFEAIPGILLIFAFAAVFGRGIGTVVLILGLTGWSGIYRQVRSEFIKHRSREYVRSAEAIGASVWSRIFTHILPNVSHVVLVRMSILVVGFIKAEVILSYLGLGVGVDDVSWGTMLAEAQSELILGHWWQLAAATLFMALFVTAFSLMTDALRDALDPKLRGLE
jgi:ABC-type dipeptide/oligopeptide/nickel transport system permease subunit